MKRLIVGLPLALSISLFAAQATLAWPDDTQASLSTRPAGISAGGTWTVDISFVSEGHILRVDSLQPSVVIENVATGERRTFQSEATAQSGVWRANVVFPSEGRWTYSVVVGISGITFDYPPVRIGPTPAAEAPTAADMPTSGAMLPLIALLAVTIAAAVGGLILARRSSDGGAIAAAEQAAPVERR
jgi:hypothetical protein